MATEKKELSLSRGQNLNEYCGKSLYDHVINNIFPHKKIFGVH